MRSMDHKKTYYNSILESVKPKFTRYLKRRGANQAARVDEEGYSIRDDLDDVSCMDFSEVSKDFKGKAKSSMAKRNKFLAAGKRQGQDDNDDQSKK